MNHLSPRLDRMPVDRADGLPADILQTARSLVPLLKGRAAETERLRRVPADSIAALRDAGLFRIVQPQRVGGYEQDFDLLVDVVIELARGCASTAWVYGLGAAHQWLVANFPLQAQQEFWATGLDTIACGSYAPAGRAVAVDGGWRISGVWEFASGSDNTQWAALGCMIPPDDEGSGEGSGGGAGDGTDGTKRAAPGFLLVPAADYRIEDNWHTVGLSGTGSKNLVLTDVFVPAHRLLTFAAITAGQTPGSLVHTNPLYRIPMLCNIPSCLAGTAVGAAIGALDDYLDSTRARVTRGAVAGANSRMAEHATIQLRVAEAAAAVDAARTVLIRDLRATAAASRNAGTVSVAERILSRRGQSFAVRLAVQAANALNASTGGYGLFLSNTVQRAWRDVNAISQHISMNWDAVGTMSGQHALGLEPKGQY